MCPSAFVLYRHKRSRDPETVDKGKMIRGYSMVKNSRFSKEKDKVKTIVIGIGDCGWHVVNEMAGKDKQIDYLVLDTDKKILDDTKSYDQILIGNDLLVGNGANGVPELGQKAEEGNSEDISKAVKGYDVAVIVCGMGGGTGTGASSVVAQIAEKEGIQTVGIVTRPFTFEGRVRAENASSGIKRLGTVADALIEVPCDKVLKLVEKDASMADTLEKVDGFIRKAVLDIADIANIPVISFSNKTGNA